MQKKMAQYTYQTWPGILVLGLTLFLTACGQKSDEDATTPAAAKPLDSIQLLDTRPTGALAVKAAREQLKPGDEAVVYGQIGGADEPFFAGYAGFVLGDTAILFCDEMGDDHCASPWDACCEDPDKLKASRASVQFVDAEGLPLETSLKGQPGLEPLRKITVTGKVAAASSPENLIIEARAFYLE